MRIEEVAGELYALVPEDFTAARNARAGEIKTGGDAGLATAVRSLRRPTAGAYLLNRLVRDEPDTVAQVVELGERLRAAQGTRSAAELRSLDEERRRLTRAVARQAAESARGEGRTVSAAVAGAVEETLRSAMVDADAGAALRTGLLVDTFSATGLDPVDLSRVVAVPGAAPPPRAAAPAPRAVEPDPAEVAAARDRVAAAEADLERAQTASGEARRRAVEAGRRREDLQSELTEVRRRLADLEQRVAAAVEAEQDARRVQLAATRQEREAVDADARARRRLEALSG